MRAYQGLRIAYLPKAAFSEILRFSAQVEELASEIGDDATALGAGISQVIITTILSDVSAVLPRAKKTLEVAEARGAPAFIATAAFALSQAYWFHGAYVKSVEVAKKYDHLFVPEVDHLATTSMTGAVYILGKGTHANALSLLGRLDEAASICNQMGDIVRETGKAYDIAFHAISTGIMALHKDDISASLEHLQFAMETSEAAKLDVLSAFLCAPLAKAYARVGRYDAAMSALKLGYRIAEGPVALEAFVAQLLAAELEILSDQGPSSQKEGLERRLLQMCRKNGYEGLLRLCSTEA